MNPRNNREWLRLSHFLSASRANGPGIRAVIWVHGCSLGCPGCFNPETHSLTGGEWVRVEELAERVIALQDTIEGITLSGGEPLQQRPAVTALLQRLKAQTALSVILFSGFTWAEIEAMGCPDLLQAVDVVIAGRYDASQRLAHSLRGSANKTLHFLTGRYTAADILATPAAEVIVLPNGDITISGIDPPKLDQ